tara:strand:- start:92 stop:316 length:225 start_codon:yes stop_codon:yes gene_type:complete
MAEDSRFTKEQLAEQDRLAKEWKKNQYQRDRQQVYPTLEELIVALVEKEEGDDAAWKELVARRKKIKTDIPKPS